MNLPPYGSGAAPNQRLVVANRCELPKRTFSSIFPMKIMISVEKPKRFHEFPETM